MTRPIGYYTVSDAAQAIATNYGFYAEKMRVDQLRIAIAFCAISPEMVKLNPEIIQHWGEPYKFEIVEFKGEQAVSYKPAFIAILEQATEGERLELLPFFVDALRSR